GLPREVVDGLVSRRWAGNARELQNAILAYAAIGALPDRPRSEPRELWQMLAPVVDLRRPYADQKDEVTDAFTRVYLVALMAMTGGNQSEAARISGLNRTHLGRMLAKHGLARGGAGQGDEDGS